MNKYIFPSLKARLQIMDKKLTDSEIVKDLKEILEIMLTMGDLQKAATIRNSFDLINRLQSKNKNLQERNVILRGAVDHLRKNNKRLSTLAELGKTRANDYRVMRDRALKAEKEVERLETENLVLSQKRANIFEISNAFQRGRLKGIEEFAERCKGCFPSIAGAFDCFAKKLVGEDSAKTEKP